MAFDTLTGQSKGTILLHSNARKHITRFDKNVATKYLTKLKLHQKKIKVITEN